MSKSKKTKEIDRAMLQLIVACGDPAFEKELEKLTAVVGRVKARVAAKADDDPDKDET